MTPAPQRPAPRWSLLRASEPERARLGTIMLAAMLLLTHAVFALSLPAVTWRDTRSLIPHLTFGPPVLGLLLFCLWRRRMSLRLSRVLFFGLALLALPSIVTLDTVMSSQGRPWTPFVGERAVLLGLGLFSPLTTAASLVLVVLYVGTSWVHWVVQVRELQPLASWTPWVTVVWGAMTCALMRYRRGVNEALSEAASAREEVETLRSAARTLLVVRDGVNTPLQTLAIGLEMLERNPHLTVQLLPSLKRAHAQLRELMQHSAEVEDPLRTWEAEELSPNPHAELKRLGERLAQLERQQPPH
jgi:hypothetical protein